MSEFSVLGLNTNTLPKSVDELRKLTEAAYSFREIINDLLDDDKEKLETDNDYYFEEICQC